MTLDLHFSFCSRRTQSTLDLEISRPRVGVAFGSIADPPCACGLPTGGRAPDTVRSLRMDWRPGTDLQSGFYPRAQTRCPGRRPVRPQANRNTVRFTIQGRASPRAGSGAEKFIEDLRHRFRLFEVQHVARLHDRLLEAGDASPAVLAAALLVSLKEGRVPRQYQETRCLDAAPAGLRLLAPVEDGIDALVAGVVPELEAPVRAPARPLRGHEGGAIRVEARRGLQYPGRDLFEARVVREGRRRAPLIQPSRIAIRRLVRPGLVEAEGVEADCPGHPFRPRPRVKPGHVAAHAVPDE